MVYTLSLTSQGQISIPAKVRRELGFKKPGKVLAVVDNGKLIVEPVRGVLSLRGALAGRKLTQKDMRAIREGFGERG